MRNLIVFLLLPATLQSQPASITEALPDPFLLGSYRARMEEQIPQRRWSARWRVTNLTGHRGSRFYSRWSFLRQRWEGSLVTERDPGEAKWNDHLVGYLQQRHGRHLVTVGDLRPGFGQGLLFGRGSGRQNGRRIGEARTIGARSSMETRSIRGVAWQVRTGPWSWTILAAGLRWDARIDSTGHVTSLPVSGLHVGATSKAGRRLLAGQAAGGRLVRRLGSLQLGATIQWLRFGRSLALASRHGGWLFASSIQAAGALDLDWTRGRWRTYGELSRTGTAWAGVAGIQASRSGPLRGSLQIRSYSPQFFSPLGASARRWQTANERGFAAEVRGGRWRTWVDGSIRPRAWSIPTSDVSGEAGWEGFWRRRPYELRFTLRQRHDLDWNEGRRWRSGRLLRLRATAGGAARRLRLQLQRHETQGDRGVALGVEGRWHGDRLTGVWQSSLFRIPVWAARVYEYEPGLPGTVSILPLYGSGWRLKGALRCRVGEWEVSLTGRWERRQVLPSRRRFGLQIDRHAPSK